MINKIKNSLLKSIHIRTYVGFLRAFWLIKIRKKLVLHQGSDSVSEHTIFSNLRRVKNNKDNPHPKAKYLFGIDKAQDGSKVRLLMNPLMSIDKVNSKISKIKLLVIGPKLESEILSIRSYGILKKNIDAIDLISYSPWIKSGDMHDLPYEDSTFDVIISGWVIAYSDNKQKAVDEMIRVAKDGAIICIGVGYTPSSNSEIIQKRGYLIGSEERILNNQFIFDLFKERIDKIYFKHDIDDNRKKTPGKILSLFSIKK